MISGAVLKFNSMSSAKTTAWKRWYTVEFKMS
jgi:hypothetical protein